MSRSEAGTQWAGAPPGGAPAHERPVELIEAKDVERAERLLRKHLPPADDLLGGDRTRSGYDLMA